MKSTKVFVFVALLVLASMLLAACQPAATATVAAPAATEAKAAEPTATTAPAAPEATATTAPAASTGDKVFRVAMDASWPPFEMLDDASKQPMGFDVDLVNAIAAKAGIKVEFVNIPFDSVLTGLAQCQVDAAASAITITEDRKKSMLFTDPYFAAGQIVSINVKNTEIKSKEDLKGKKVGAMLGTTGAIEAEKIEGVKFSAYDTIDQAFLDLMNGQIDAVLADNPLAIGYIAKNSEKIKSVGEVFTDENYGIAVCNKQTDLYEKLNKGLAEIKADGTIDQLVDKWLKK